MVRKFLTGIALLLAFATFALAQKGDTGAESQKPSIRKVPARQTSAASGKEMYESYCASCHGRDAKGDGPAAKALKTAPSDLTTLAERNGGQFPAMRVQGVITGQVELAAHGAKDMPVWGPVFLRLSQGRPSEVKLRIDNLTDYIKSLQLK
ncbi:MAG TPA: cytochrome c [Terriglobales bacterium]|jgi:mono/diheme cytochrome c family protein|nr:cytochrome c [Terriglobales bacterium]